MTVTGYLECGKTCTIAFSDGQATNANGSYSEDSTKIFRLKDTQYALGFAGVSSYKRALLREIEPRISNSMEYEELRDNVIDCYNDFIKNRFKKWAKNEAEHNGKKFNKKFKRKVREEFEEDFSIDFIFTGFSKENESVMSFIYHDGIIVESLKYDFIGCGHNEAYASAVKHIKTSTRDDNKHINKSKAVRTCLESLRYAESDYVGGEPQIVIIDENQYRELTSQEVYILNRSLAIEDQEFIDRKTTNRIFGHIIEKSSDPKEVIDLIKSKIPVEKAYELLLTRPL